MKDKILELYLLGYKPSEIAKLLNVSRDYVSRTLSNIKKEEKLKKKALKFQKNLKGVVEWLIDSYEVVFSKNIQDILYSKKDLILKQLNNLSFNEIVTILDSFKNLLNFDLNDMITSKKENASNEKTNPSLDLEKSKENDNFEINNEIDEEELEKKNMEVSTGYFGKELKKFLDTRFKIDNEFVEEKEKIHKEILELNKELLKCIETNDKERINEIQSLIREKQILLKKLSQKSQKDDTSKQESQGTVKLEKNKNSNNGNNENGINGNGKIEKIETQEKNIKNENEENVLVNTQGLQESEEVMRKKRKKRNLTKSDAINLVVNENDKENLFDNKDNQKLQRARDALELRNRFYQKAGLKPEKMEKNKEINLLYTLLEDYSKEEIWEAMVDYLESEPIEYWKIEYFIAVRKSFLIKNETREKMRTLLDRLNYEFGWGYSFDKNIRSKLLNIVLKYSEDDIEKAILGFKKKIIDDYVVSRDKKVLINMNIRSFLERFEDWINYRSIDEISEKAMNIYLKM